MSGRYAIGFIAGWDAVLASASRALEPAPKHGDTHGNRTVAAANAGCAETARSTRVGRTSSKKKFVAMTLATLAAADFSHFFDFNRSLYRWL
ncbi:MAG TPA: hypothetical protein VGJ48_25225 [Pyrinomonadaceae bacterium]